MSKRWAADRISLVWRTIPRANKKGVQEQLQRLAVGVRRVVGEVVERIPKPSLPKHLKRGTCHPAIDVQLFCCAVLWKTFVDSLSDLKSFVSWTLD